jgi:hypothetical protein
MQFLGVDAAFRGGAETAPRCRMWLGEVLLAGINRAGVARAVSPVSHQLKLRHLVLLTVQEEGSSSL